MSKNSKQRDTILRVVMSTTTHPQADWVYDQVRKEIPNISLGTVYRNLKLLARDGIIKELDAQDGPARFDGNSQDHYHFRCENCLRIFDLAEPQDHTLEARIAEKTGFKIKGHYLEFIGLCSDCHKSEKG